ncbi:nucleolar complex protein 3 homolog [Pectinophora gossypiella]|nr:nucleolar complex protein 3 homolog [Pectinophora gossypiella]
MAKKGKAKISKVKRNNQTTNKMKKQGKLKLQRHRNKVQKQRPPQTPKVEYSSESDSASGDEWTDMLDDDEQKYIMSRLAKQPQLLSNVPEEEKQNKSRKRKREKQEKPPKPMIGSDSGAESEGSASDSDLEEKYEKELAERPAKRLRPLLPIKTKQGLQERAEECEDSESEQDDDQTQSKPKQKQDVESDEEGSDDSGVEGTEEGEAEGEASGGEGSEGEITAVQLLAARRDRLAHDKLRIGALCSSLLESPEKKLKNLYPILYLMEERLKDDTLNLCSVRKLATLSACEVFRDILPEYSIRHQDYSNVKLKKDTLALYKYEKELLEFYKRYLQRLEKSATLLRQKKGDTRKLEDATLSLSLVSLRCMCSMLVSRPHFNYATNIAQSVVPFLACRDQRARDIVTESCTQVFAEDNKGDITLTIVRLINQLVKRRGERLHPSALDCLLTLKIRDVDMDAETDIKHKKRQDEKHKKRIVNLSKKEKKRAKKLKEVERELMETQAQESEAARRKQLTEVTRTVFHIYFRLLKTAPGSKLLAAALNGLAKFTHVINLEYYSDLVGILRQLLVSESVGAREKLLVVRTVLSVLAGAGDALNVDPATFHAHLYCHALDAHAGRSHEDAKIIIEAAAQICARARRVSPAVLTAFAKRLLTLATQLHHNGALACLALVHQLAQQSKAVTSMLETDVETASGRFDPFLSSPEHCNAHAAALHELAVLTSHYHPTVRDAARALVENRGLPELAKMTPAHVFSQYDGSQMAFKPAIPPPKKASQPAKVKPHHAWAQASLKEFCDSVENNVNMTLLSER